MIKTVFGIFRIKREERWLAVFAFIWMVALNVLTITKYYDKFTQIMDTYHRHFVNVWLRPTDIFGSVQLGHEL